MIHLQPENPKQDVLPAPDSGNASSSISPKEPERQNPPSPRLKLLLENSPDDCPREEQLYFEVEVENEKGPAPAIVTVSCVNANEPYKHDAHRRFVLGGKNCRADGICLVPITNDAAKAIISDIFVRYRDGCDEPDRNPHVIKLKFELTIGSRTLNSVVSEPIYDADYFSVNDTDVNGEYLIPRIEIIDQPASDIRFCYRSELGGRMPANIHGVKSNFPTIRLLGCRGPTRVELSCVTKDGPYRMHPHNLFSKVGEGIYAVQVNEASNVIVPIKNVGIIATKKDDFEVALSARRKQLTYNPFAHNENNGGKRYFRSLRILCQAYTRAPGQENYSIIVPHVLSEPMHSSYPKKPNKTLHILYKSRESGSVRGGTLMSIFCRKVAKEEIEIIFFEGDGSWSAPVRDLQTHGKIGFAFRTPPYYDETITQPKKVYIKIKRNTEEGNAVEFTFLPVDVVMGQVTDDLDEFLNNYVEEMMVDSSLPRAPLPDHQNLRPQTSQSVGGSSFVGPSSGTVDTIPRCVDNTCLCCGPEHSYL